MTTDQKIANLKNGQEIRLSGDTNVWVTAERSGDGKKLRFVRHTAAGFVVFRSVAF